MSCQSRHDCKLDEYCDVSTSICEPCRQICRSELSNTYICAQFCPHWTSFTTTPLMSTTGWSNKSPRFEGIWLYMSIPMIVVLLIIVIILAVKLGKPWQQTLTARKDNPTPRRAQRKWPWKKLGRERKLRTKRDSHVTQPNDVFSNNVGETSGKWPIKEGDCEYGYTGSGGQYHSLNGNPISFPTDDVPADKHQLLLSGQNDASRQHQLADGETKRKSCYNDTIESHHNRSSVMRQPNGNLPNICLPTFISWSPVDDTESTREFSFRSDFALAPIARRPTPIDEHRTTSSGQLSLVLKAYDAVKNHTEVLPFIKFCMLDNDALRITVRDGYDVDECYREIMGILPVDVPGHLVCVYHASEQM